MKKLIFPLMILIAAVLVESCSSGKQAYERGNYDEAVLKAIHRLRKNPNSKKAAQTLRDSYPLTIDWHRDNIQRAKNSTYEFKWEQVVSEYQQINYIYGELSRCPACRRIIPNAVSYQKELNNAKRQAADIRYQKGEEILARARESHDRYEAREAFQHFEKVINLLGDYREVRDKIDEAKWLATLKVLVEPIPMHSRNLQISNEFFENKIMEFVETMPVNEFVQFYSYEEAKNIGLEEPDQIIQLQFDDFILGQVYLKEKEIQLSKDSVVLAVIKAHNEVDMSDALAANVNIHEVLKYQQRIPVLESPHQEFGNKKVTICHKVAGSLGTSTTITVSQNALQHHLDHGDVQGPCQGETDPQKKPKKDKPNQDSSQDNHDQSQGSGDSQDQQGSGNTYQDSEGDQQSNSGTGNSDSHNQDNGQQGQNEGSDNSGSNQSHDSHQNSGSDQSDSGSDPGPDVKKRPKTQKVYGTVKATMHVFHKSLTSAGLLDFKIIDFHSKRVLTHEKMPGEFVWYTEWGYFNGDERALDDYFKEIVKLKEAPPPAPQDLFVAFTQPIYGQITQKIRHFYRNY